MQVRTCLKHGEEVHHEYADGRFRCKTCVAEYVRKRSQTMRKQMIEERGNKCECCGYKKYTGILQFHHIDPTTKEFNVGTGTRGIERQQKEADKCLLLCPNCHLEKHLLETKPD